MGSLVYDHVSTQEHAPTFSRGSDSEKHVGTRNRFDDTFSNVDESARRSKIVRTLQRARRARDLCFDSTLFADPAWDMLLELYASHLEQRRIAVSSLCAAAHVPATTALRWISKLEQDGLAVRRDDPNDGRRSWIELSFDGAEKMSRYFDMLPSGGVLR